MKIEEYFKEFNKATERAYAVATRARQKGYDPETFIEIKPAPDLPSRVEGIIGVANLAALIKEKSDGKSRQELAFEMVKEICTNDRFAMEKVERMTLAVRVGLSILTEGILVAPTEGLPGIELHKNPDGTEYAAVIYAGPIRSAGGTAAALSVTLCDYARKLLGVDQYKPQKTEVERCLEEILLYHTRSGKHLQYLPSEHDIRMILENSPVCVDGMPTEEIEVSVHRNVKRLEIDGTEKVMTNRVRGGVALVVCEGIAQKSKSVLKYAKAAGLDWSWLNEIIKVDKATFGAGMREERNDPAFLKELVGGRPVISYPNHRGGFRLRYGRSRLTGIAAKGFSPATMIILDEFIATGTQVKIEKPGKGSIAMPVDTIEGPFVKLKSGEAFRVNSAEHARQLTGQVDKILSVGDMLITLGDFKKSNTPLVPTSYVEEFWYAQLKKNGYEGDMPEVNSFESAYGFSKKYKVPIHPKYLYDYHELTVQEVKNLANVVISAGIKAKGSSIFDLEEISIGEPAANSVRIQVESLCIPHEESNGIRIKGGDAQSLVASLGLTKDEKINLDTGIPEKYNGEDTVAALNSVSPFTIMQRSSTIGARIGRPEKARERLMKPAPNGIFPVGEAGGKERNLSKAYFIAKKQFSGLGAEVEIANYRCAKGGEQLSSPYCAVHGCKAVTERICPSCGRKSTEQKCGYCGSKTTGSSMRRLDIARELDGAKQRLQIDILPKTIKGVKRLMNKDRIPEPVEKAVLRSLFGVYTFKDGTSRFDATDAPITHFYPNEISTSVGKLAELGYTEDCNGERLERGDQLVELRHQDLIVNNRCGEYLLKVSKFVDALLVNYYGIEPFYNAQAKEDIIGQYVITLSPHTSAGVLGRIIGFTEANVGLAHPYTITARRRNCDGDEDTTMLLLDALLNFSRKYLPSMIGGTMDAPLILTVNVKPEEVDDEAWQMEVVKYYGLDFYLKTLEKSPPSEAVVESVGSRLNKESIYDGLEFTHKSTAMALIDAPVKSIYTKLKTMDEKIDLQFKLMDRLYSIDKRDTARRLISNHFIRDLMGNLHSYSQQGFRCSSCNAKYRRIPLIGRCTRCKGKILLTISKGGIEKYLKTATDLAERYDLEPYMKQRIYLLKYEIQNVFGETTADGEAKQFNLSKFM